MTATVAVDPRDRLADAIPRLRAFGISLTLASIGYGKGI